MNYIQYMKPGGTIHIKKKNKGKFTDYCGGKVTEECIRKGKNSSNPTTRKRANFAANARKWKHEEGGTLNYLNYFNEKTMTPEINTTEYYTITPASYGLNYDLVKIPFKEKLAQRQAWKNLRPFIEDQGFEWSRKADPQILNTLATMQYDNLRTVQLATQALYPSGYVKVPAQSGLVPSLFTTHAQPRRVAAVPASIVHHVQEQTSKNVGEELNYLNYSK